MLNHQMISIVGSKRMLYLLGKDELHKCCFKQPVKAAICLAPENAKDPGASILGIPNDPLSKQNFL